MATGAVMGGVALLGFRKHFTSDLILKLTATGVPYILI
jgi:hypothetical protein